MKFCEEMIGQLGHKPHRDKSGEPAPVERMPKCKRCGRVRPLCVCDHTTRKGGK